MYANKRVLYVGIVDFAQSADSAKYGADVDRVFGVDYAVMVIHILYC